VAKAARDPSLYRPLRYHRAVWGLARGARSLAAAAQQQPPRADAALDMGWRVTVLPSPASGPQHYRMGLGVGVWLDLS
jgi:hypothetical protein